MTTTLGQQLAESVVGVAYAKVESFITTNDQDTGVKRVVKIGAGMVANPLFAVASAVETVVRAVLTLLAKMVHFFMPKDSEIANKFQNKILKPLILSTLENGVLTGVSAAQTVTNFLSEKSQTAVINALFAPVKAIYEHISTEGTVGNAILNGHINGVTAPSDPDAE